MYFLPIAIQCNRQNYSYNTQEELSKFAHDPDLKLVSSLGIKNSKIKYTLHPLAYFLLIDDDWYIYNCIISCSILTNKLIKQGASALLRHTLTFF